MRWKGDCPSLSRDERRKNMKKLSVLLLIVAMSIALLGCRGGGSTPEPTEEGGKISLKFWNSLTGADGSVMRQLIAQFNQEHLNDIEVIETFTNEVDYYTNINLLVPMKKGPDVMIMHSYLVQSYANTGLIEPLESYIETSGVDIKSSDYMEDIFNSLYFEDELYGVPLDVHTVGIYYNKDLLEAYDLEVPTNRSELIAAAKTVQTGEKVTNAQFWGLPLASVWPSEWIFTASLYQNNGLEIDENGDPAYHTPEGVNALKALTDLIHTENLSPLNLGVDQDLFMFQTGKALFHIQGSWMLNSMIESGINFGVLPVSRMFNLSETATKDQIPVRSHTFVIPKPSVEMTDRRQEAIMTFVKYLGDHSYIWATAGQIPASNIARATAEYQALPYHAGFGDINNFRISAQSPYFHQAYSPVYSRVTAAMANKNYNADLLLGAAVEEALLLLQEARS
jgi:multiple sugar transport system substrate-binding protein